MNKEQVYDEKINPLMAKILEICNEHKIAMIASFAIPNDGNEDLRCTSATCADDHNPPKDFLRALQIVRSGYKPMMMLTAEHADGSKTLTSIID